MRYATTSAALKLLRLRRMLRRPGRSDFDAGTTTDDALFATQVPDEAAAALTIAAATAGDSCTEPVELWCIRLPLTNVGRRDGVGEPGCRGRRGRPVTGAGGNAPSFDEPAPPRADVSLARRGILFGCWPFAFVVFAVPRTGVAFFAATMVEERVTRTGRCSETGTR